MNVQSVNLNSFWNTDFSDREFQTNTCKLLQQHDLAKGRRLRRKRRLDVMKMRGRRNKQIEAELQQTLDEEGNVWAIGDVHGYADTLLALLDSLNLSSRDRVVLLGDLVDRGPKSCRSDQNC